MAYTPPTLPYYGPVAHSSGTGNLPINRIVIHCTAGNDAKGAQGTARYFRDPNASGSAHYIVDSDESIQCAHDNVVCWHAPPNTHSLGIEMECSLANRGQGHWTRADHIAMMHRTAKLTAQKCLQHNVPVVKLDPADLRAGRHGICGHWDVTLAFGQSSHTDPEKYFPWTPFMGWVHEEYAAITGDTPAPPPPPKEEWNMATADQVLAAVQALSAKIDAPPEDEAAAAGRYSDLKNTMIKWAEDHDNARQAELNGKLDAIVAAQAELKTAVEALAPKA